MTIIHRIKNLIWQNHTCAVCGKHSAEDLLCPACRNTLDNLVSCNRCGYFLPQSQVLSHRCNTPPHLAALLSCYPYTSPLKERLFGLKYHNQPKIALPLGRLLARRLADFAPMPLNNAVIVPIPLHPKRQAERGYNQSDILAKVLAAELDIPLCPHAVKRVKHTLPLHSLSANERQQNLQNAFAPDKDIAKIRGKRVILVDDIITTGTTMQYTAAVLKGAGAAEIYGLAASGHLVK